MMSEIVADEEPDIYKLVLMDPVNSDSNSRRIAAVENCFGSSGQPLAVPGRVLVGEGSLTKMCRKKPKPRQFFLFNDILVYGNIVLDKKKYNQQRIIPLEDIKLESLENDDQFQNGWLVRTATKSFAVYAATASEKEEWMLHINKCVGDRLKKSGKKASSEHAAVWVPDAEANMCMHCKKTQFSLVNRRHHCRKCGAVVCSPCSSKKWLLPNQSPKPLRVCLTCYDALSKAKIDHSPPPQSSKAVPPAEQHGASGEEAMADKAEQPKGHRKLLSEASLWWDSIGQELDEDAKPASGDSSSDDYTDDEIDVDELIASLPPPSEGNPAIFYHDQNVGVGVLCDTDTKKTT